MVDRAAVAVWLEGYMLLCFDGEGRCIEYREWYMKRPAIEDTASEIEP